MFPEGWQKNIDELPSKNEAIISELSGIRSQLDNKNSFNKAELLLLQSIYISCANPLHPDDATTYKPSHETDERLADKFPINHIAICCRKFFDAID